MARWTFDVIVDVDAPTVTEAIVELRRRMYAGFLPDFTATNVIGGEDDEEMDEDEIRKVLDGAPLPWQESTPNTTEEEAQS